MTTEFTYTASAGSSPRPRRARLMSTLLITLTALVLLAIAGSALVLPAADDITRGVTLCGVPLGGLPRAEAKRVIGDTLSRAITGNITLIAGAHRFEATLPGLGISADPERALRAAYALGRDGSLPRRLHEAVRARCAGITLAPSFIMDPQQAQTMLAAFATQTDHPPINAAAHWDEVAQRVSITPGRAGALLDIPASLEILDQSLLQNLRTGRPLPETLTLAYQDNPPRVTEAMLKEIDTLLGSYTTTYATSTRNRANNVDTAARAIDGTVLLPGETFSFNKIVGPRDPDNGFRTAPVIVDGQLQPGMGGGVCQVSTTLYNAALLANLAIVARSHHSLPVHYVPPGQDATVAYGAIDFKFTNSMATPVLIEAKTGGRRLTMRVLGKGPTPTVHIERSGITSLPGRSKTIKDPTLPLGVKKIEKRGKAGMAVTVTRVVGDGADARREVLSHDRYLGELSIVRIGTGAASATNTSMLSGN